jgi:hypothetical protein
MCSGATQFGDGLDQRLFVVEKGAAGTDAPVFVSGLVQRGPLAGSRCIHRGRVHALLHVSDQIQLPGASFDLPVAEGDQAGNGRHCKDSQDCQQYRREGTG